MIKEKKSCGLGKFLMVIVGATLMATGFVLIPPLIEKYSNKMYKCSLRNNDIDFENMEPEIITHDKTKGE